MITEANAAPHDGDTREPALITRAQQGDADAFAELYKTHYEAIRLYILRRNGWDRSLADDLAADVFLRAFNKIGTFTWNGKSIGAWLRVIAKNRVADHYKVSTTRLLHHVGDTSELEYWCQTSADATEDTVLASLDEADLLTALGALRPRQQEVLRLRFLDEMSLSETADAVGVTTGAVKQLQFRAIDSLRRAYRGAAA